MKANIYPLVKTYDVNSKYLNGHRNEVFNCVSGCVKVARGYADFMAASSSYVQALKLNTEALQDVGKLKLAHPHLAADVMDQTLCIEQAKASSVEPKKSKQISLFS